MAEIVTKQQLENASVDADSLEVFVSGSDMEDVLTRLGQQYPTIAKLVRILMETGGWKAYQTEAALLATTPTVNPSVGYAFDTKKMYLWNGTSWIDEGLSQLDQAVDVIDSRIELGDGEHLITLKDALGRVLSYMDQSGHLYLPYLEKSMQSEILDLIRTSETVRATIEQGELNNVIFKIISLGSETVSYMDQSGHLYVPHLKDSVQIEVQQLQSQIMSLAQLISNSNNNEKPDPIDQAIGGVELDAEGDVGSIYEGFKLSAGDDFNQLDILAPHRPLGRWFTTRTYLAGARGSDGALNRQYNTDPFHTGFNDSNRGEPVGYNNMFVENSILTLNARRATIEEAEHFEGSGRKELAALISSIGAFSMYPSDDGTGENILEWRVRYVAEDNQGYASGWHPTLWTQSSLPSITYNSNEWDVLEANKSRAYVNYNEWGADGKLIAGSTLANTNILHNGQWHTVTAKFSHGHLVVYLDGTLFRTFDVDTNNFNEPAYSLITNHVYNGTFAGDTYNEEEWAAKSLGMTMQIDWVRLWRKSDRKHIKSLQRIIPIDIVYGVTGIIALPPKLNLWGQVDVKEHVQCVSAEENEPGGHHSIAYDSLPNFVNYDKEKRTVLINTEGQKSGRLNFVIYGYLQDGSTCEPARTYANVAPNITVNTITMPQTGAFDLYAACDCGVLVTDGVIRTKKITVSNLPSSVVYNDATGLLSSNSANVLTTTIIVSCENSVGQMTTKRVKLIIGA
ncbi:LamG domain-containing protein [Acinetobacter haemolyticus]|uniref:hypothetical protein n=1 Tax=Acinetobacter haemolyticus TaxID=29430 RepID=UPI001D182950|nr:hypothetical protein [Acinetobacter haemolyticus]